MGCAVVVVIFSQIKYYLRLISKYNLIYSWYLWAHSICVNVYIRLFQMFMCLESYLTVLKWNIWIGSNPYHYFHFGKTRSFVRLLVMYKSDNATAVAAPPASHQPKEKFIIMAFHSVSLSHFRPPPSLETHDKKVLMSISKHTQTPVLAPREGKRTNIWWKK